MERACCFPPGVGPAIGIASNSLPKGATKYAVARRIVFIGINSEFQGTQPGDNLVKLHFEGNSLHEPGEPIQFKKERMYLCNCSYTRGYRYLYSGDSLPLHELILRIKGSFPSRSL